MPNGIQQYTKLEHRLVLLAWLNSLFGYESNRAMLEDCKDVAEGYASDGHSHLYHHLLARGSKVKIPEKDLARYDDNIRRHLEAINRNRPEPITLRYFQHLAALYTEVFLDRLFNRKAQLLADLNAFVIERNARKLPGEPEDDSFAEEDLTKLAYWMATGSGKTLLLHLNYYQFLHYNREPLDNILLITPNEGLSEQHLRELELSGIPARRFDLNQSGLFRTPNEVQVLEITKLVEEKRGGGVSVPVEDFEGRNLIFVDEGHKGAGGQAWRSYRDALGATGFTFEYSATFGQALSAAGDDELTREYGKAIIFDYSYRYFYGDGFGKDFRILNLQNDTDEEHTNILFLGNLLSFYEQLRLYEECGDKLRPYNLEKPLWVFVGSTVNAVYSENRQKRSDVLTVACFLHHLLSDRKWAVETIGKLLKAQSGLRGPDGADVFVDRFKYLKELVETPAALYADILRRVFHAPAGGGLHLADIRGSDGEIGLKAAAAERYFGLIYIGDTSAFKKLAEEQAPEITLEEDAVGASLFGDINRPDSDIHVLIGAKKFMEGWNSWRVASMGLLNIGRSEGSQIIQLFGRGVRLKGKNFSLKRSSALLEKHPQHIELLETLNIFAVRANYMAQFRDYLEREGVETEPVIELPLFTWINEPALKKNLVIPRTPEGRDFLREERLALEADEHINVRQDLSVRVQMMASTAGGLHQVLAQSGLERQIPAESLALVDWEQVYLDLLEYKARKGWRNLIIRPETPRQLMGEINYTLIADEATVRPRTFAERQRLQEAVTAILCKYMDTFYRRHRERWESQNMEYGLLDENDPNLAFNREQVKENKAAYIVRVPRSDAELLAKIQQLIADADRLYRQENQGLPRITFDRHLYLPLLVEKADVLKSIPPALKESEAQFVRDLKAYWEAEKDRSLAGKEVFLLRNLSRGKGIGFFEERGFYPDFILWVLEGKAQRIIFVEPHGMLHAKAYIHDEKARLHERLRDLALEIAQRSGRQDVSLDAFILSATPFDELRPRYGDGKWKRATFAENHILFMERGDEYNYIAKILSPNRSVC
ncbi:type III restriction endonuclease subunit R [Hydrogenophilus thermoluteolus]|uniref:DEAD/DEAH box helicase family protein n=1 Tax=Hydrogenophilus thermoluteolus TaxID=297 RepID=UPI0024A22BC4|nr:DEAD/DEAH box helicase family protein [Hydrogenophilus thermoluteolus]GLW60406.1 type III restriction endonuclease subunit R [Hydrogenophilus thermoluteolus]